MDATVLVVEDDDFIRMALVGTLTHHGVNVVAHCPNAAEAMAAQKEFRPDVALVDLDLGRGPTGLDLARSLRLANPAIGLVFLTSYSDPRLVASPGQEAPAGSQYLVKRSVSSVEIVIDALRKSLTSHKVARWGPQGSSEFGKLTRSQVETLRLVAAGDSNQEIARKRSITEKSVEQQIGRIAKRLGIEREMDKNLRVSIARTYFLEAGSGRDPVD